MKFKMKFDVFLMKSNFIKEVTFSENDDAVSAIKFFMFHLIISKQMYSIPH